MINSDVGNSEINIFKKTFSGIYVFEKQLSLYS